MSLSQEDVKKIAHLARLNVSEIETALFAPQLSNILNFIKQMDQVQTAQVEPMAHPLDDLSQRLRPDTINEQDLRDKYQQIAPQAKDGVYLVPRVIEEA
ncbi:MAG TPA: Asp-tRNA(Asn)/Glu-tRNA(Gln) amidotransferase subunit GatC [Gammaproteobacteria bacterium]|jgi:aspartyl-tRNA(Asn)/glutamyl-tRNA(Gln) amidotransferase subunit C|nr:Asp-tRNA(Asn)/Glu-tRNA(Gln) amidotransferase subunit GatC [Gammaproteobacteria bacterium]